MEKGAFFSIMIYYKASYIHFFHWIMQSLLKGLSPFKYVIGSTTIGSGSHETDIFNYTSSPNPLAHPLLWYYFFFLGDGSSFIQFFSYCPLFLHMTGPNQYFVPIVSLSLSLSYNQHFPYCDVYFHNLIFCIFTTCHVCKVM